MKRLIAFVSCGDDVQEIEGRHVGRVRAIRSANGRALFVTIEWLDTGWISELVDVRDLTYAGR